MNPKCFDADTIAAISTGTGEGGIGVVRLSGKDAFTIADRVFRAKSGAPVSAQKSFTAQYGHVVEKKPEGERVLDEAIALVMRAPKTYTRENVVELSVHGGPAALAAVLSAVLEAGARHAERGEFTKRAFLNGRIDLVQAEAVLDMVGAKTELAQRWAAAALDGALSLDMKALKTELIDLLSHLEASIDFPDDRPDTEPIAATARRLSACQAKLEKWMAGSEMGLLVKSGICAVIAGRPNVGKSSLMNRLARKDRVIVTALPGTTRDTVEETVQLRGLPLRIVDTAGIQATEHAIERAGIERSKLAVGAAELVLYVLDSSRPLEEEDRELLEGLGTKKKVLVLNKSDLPRKLDRSMLGVYPAEAVVETSCVSDRGVEELENEIFKILTNGRAVGSDDAVINTARQRDWVLKALEAVRRARKAADEHASPELIAVDMRLALDSLAGLAGEAVTDDVLEALFAQFCIGK